MKLVWKSVFEFVHHSNTIKTTWSGLPKYIFEQHIKNSNLHANRVHASQEDFFRYQIFRSILSINFSSIEQNSKSFTNNLFLFKTQVNGDITKWNTMKHCNLMLTVQLDDLILRARGVAQIIRCISEAYQISRTIFVVVVDVFKWFCKQ